MATGGGLPPAFPPAPVTDCQPVTDPAHIERACTVVRRQGDSFDREFSDIKAVFSGSKRDSNKLALLRTKLDKAAEKIRTVYTKAIHICGIDAPELLQDVIRRNTVAGTLLKEIDDLLVGLSEITVTPPEQQLVEPVPREVTEAGAVAITAAQDQLTSTVREPEDDHLADVFLDQDHQLRQRERHISISSAQRLRLLSLRSDDNESVSSTSSSILRYQLKLKAATDSAAQRITLECYDEQVDAEEERVAAEALLRRATQKLERLKLEEQRKLADARQRCLDELRS